MSNKKFVLTAFEKDAEMKIGKKLDEYNFDSNENKLDIEGKDSMSTNELILYINERMDQFHQIATRASTLDNNLDAANVVKHDVTSTFNEDWANKQARIFLEFWYIYAKMIRNIKTSEIYNDAILILDDKSATSFFCFPLNIEQLDGNDKFRYYSIFIANCCFPTIYCRNYVLFFWERMRYIFINHFAQKGSSFSNQHAKFLARALMLFLTTTESFLNEMHDNFITRRVWTKNFLIAYNSTIECGEIIETVLPIVCQWLGSYCCRKEIDTTAITKISAHVQNIGLFLEKIKKSNLKAAYRELEESLAKEREKEEQRNLELSKQREEKDRKKRVKREREEQQEAQIEYYSSDDMDEDRTPSPTILKLNKKQVVPPPLKK